MMKNLLIVVLMLACTGCASTQSSSPCGKAVPGAEAAKAQITKMMHESAKAWTANDLDGFMQGFHNSQGLTFATPGGITYGWDNLKARYAKSIEKSDLRFSDLKIDVLSSTSAFVFGRFHNDQKDGGYGHGLYTLLVINVDGKWVITHDHSSDLPLDDPGAMPLDR